MTDTIDVAGIVLERLTHDQRWLLMRLEVDPGTGCWIWTGKVSNHGYGIRSRSHQLDQLAHRAVYEAFVGDIPAGLVLDHLCGEPRCCNPQHLQPVTQAENVRRGSGPTAINARKTHCIRGHEFTTPNTYRTPSGKRQCRECSRYLDSLRHDRDRDERNAAKRIRSAA